MTDKERLEVIKNKYGDKFNNNFVAQYVKPPFATVAWDDLDYFIEQAERVQELEARDEGRELAHKLVVHFAKESEKQNKRYREARNKLEEEISNTYRTNSKEEYDIGYCDGLKDALALLDEALEGEE